MIASPRIRAFVRNFEKCRLKAYKPTPNDRWTIGWGSTGRGIVQGLVWTQEQADRRFDDDCTDFSAGVTRLIGSSPTTQDQFDAMFSFAYNVGLDEDADTTAEGLGDSTLLKKHKAGDYAGAAAEFTKWNKQAGKVLNGLTTRRADEASIYKGVWPK